MQNWPTDLPRSAPTEALWSRVRGDANVVGLVLTGSWARGIPTAASDLDIYVVLARADDTWTTTRSPELDLPVVTLAELAEVPQDPWDWWDRYSFTHTRVLLDRLDGEVGRLVLRWGTLTEAEAHRTLDVFLDGYVNFAYRSLKSLRDQRFLEAHLDAVESLAWALPVVFAIHRRVRPYNKYLAWELTHHPFEDRRFDGRLLGLLEAILKTADRGAQRELFLVIEDAAREQGYGAVIDGWGDELALFRTPPR